MSRTNTIALRPWAAASFCLLAITSMVISAGSAVAADAQAKPRYQFQAGRTYVYDVKIEADLPDAKETLSGQSTYAVKSVDNASGRMTLSNSGSLATKRQNKAAAAPGRFPGRGPMMRPPFGGPFGGPNYGMAREVVLSPAGAIVSYKGDAQLPFMLGQLWQLVLEPLPPEGQQAWEVRNEITINEKNESSRPLPPFMQDPGLSRAATEAMSYKVGDSDGGVLVINKTVQLATAEKAGDHPVLEQTGQGRIKFDIAVGVVKSVEMDINITVNRENVTVKVPVTVRARLLDAEEVAKVEADRAAAAAAGKAAAEEAARPKPMDDAAISAALADLKADSNFKRSGAADRLAKAIVVEQRQGEVAKALEAALDDRDGFVRTAAAKALAAWATKDNVPALVKAADDRDLWLRAAAMSALGRLKDARGAEVVARHLGPMGDRSAAAKALQAMGSIAEKAVLPYLQDRDWAVQCEACKVLGEIGGTASVEALKGLVGKANGLVQREAQKAITAIEARRSTL